MRIKLQKQGGETYTYSDIHLDLDRVSNPRGLGGDLFKSSPTNDIKVDYDEYAIRNSLANLFKTVRGQRILSPNYGLNLHQFLFGELSENKARVIARVIREGVKKYEPRVEMQNIHITLDYDNYAYIIVMNILIPNLNNRQISYRKVLSDTGFN